MEDGNGVRKRMVARKTVFKPPPVAAPVTKTPEDNNPESTASPKESVEAKESEERVTNNNQQEQAIVQKEQESAKKKEEVPQFTAAKATAKAPPKPSGSTNNAPSSTTQTTLPNDANEYPPEWPQSARLRGAELEESIRNAPAFDMILVAMIVGFVVLHSNGLNFQQRATFHASLLNFLCAKGGRIAAMFPHLRMSLMQMNQQLYVVEQQQQQQMMMMQQRQMAAAATAAFQQRQWHQQRQQQKQTQKQPSQPSQQQTISPKQNSPDKTSPEKKKRKTLLALPSTNQEGEQEVIHIKNPEPIEGCPPLTGWTKVRRRRENGRGKGSFDNYWHTPTTNSILRSKAEIVRFFQLFNDPNDKECYQNERNSAGKAKLLGKKKTPTKGGEATSTGDAKSPKPSTFSLSGNAAETPTAHILNTKSPPSTPRETVDAMAEILQGTNSPDIDTNASVND